MSAFGTLDDHDLCSFQAGKYNESLKQLEALQEVNKEDYKISMNKAIVEFYRSGQATTGTLMQTLTAMKNQVTECLLKFGTVAYACCRPTCISICSIFKQCFPTFGHSLAILFRHPWIHKSHNYKEHILPLMFAIDFQLPFGVECTNPVLTIGHAAVYPSATTDGVWNVLVEVLECCERICNMTHRTQHQRVFSRWTLALMETWQKG